MTPEQLFVFGAIAAGACYLVYGSVHSTQHKVCALFCTVVFIAVSLFGLAELA